MSDKTAPSSDVTDVLASIRKLVSDEARVRELQEQAEAQRLAEEALQAEARAAARERALAEESEAQAAAEAEEATRLAAEAAEAEARMQAAIKAEEAAKAAAEAEAAAIAQAEAQAKVEAETLAQIEATARAEAEAAARAQLAEQAEPEYVDEDEHTGTDATDAHVTSDQQVASAAPSFLSDDAPLVLTSSQRVADTVSASAKVAADLQPSTQGTSDNSASLPSFLAVGATANNDVSLLEDVPDEEAAQAEDLVVQSPQTDPSGNHINAVPRCERLKFLQFT